MIRARASMSILAAAFALGLATHARAGHGDGYSEVEESPTAAPAAAVVEAEDEEGWTFVITPQLWVPHIDSGGFAGNASLPTVGNFARVIQGAEASFEGRNSEAVDAVDLQWGFQLAARKGRWAVGAGYQSSDFETSTNLIYTGSSVLHTNPSDPQFDITMSPGERAAREFVNTARTDVDLATSYTFPDVVPHRLDLAAGLGLKMIHAESVRHYSNMHPYVAIVNAIPPPGLYLVCKGDETCSGGQEFRERVKSTTWMYGVTIPLTAVFRLSDDARWLLPLNVLPFLGAETRDDNDVIYSQSKDNLGNPIADRQDGTYFAYGVTGDAKITWALSDTLSAYLGMRVQYMNGDSPNSDAYLAYGPLLGVSASFAMN